MPAHVACRTRLVVARLELQLQLRQQVVEPDGFEVPQARFAARVEEIDGAASLDAGDGHALAQTAHLLQHWLEVLISYYGKRDVVRPGNRGEVKHAAGQ